jgi:high-affinity iron transporter
MLQSLVITLREGVEAALIVGIVLAYLNKIGRPELRHIVYAGLGTALLGSIAAAIALSRFNFNQETFEGVVMLVAAFFVVTMVIFMARAAKTLKGDIEQRVNTFAGTGSKVGLFLFVFLMVFREGAETVLILSAVSITTNELLSFLGTLIGVALSVLFGVMFVRGSVRIDLGRFFKVTTVILVFVALQLTISGLHELSEAGVIPSSKSRMAVIGPIVRNDVFFFVTLLALAALMVLFESGTRKPTPLASDASKAEHRKAVWSARRERLWASAVYVSSFVFIMLVTAQFIYAKRVTALSPANVVTFTDGKTAIDISGMRDGDLWRYSADVAGKEIRFLLYKKPDGKVATIMDACSICGSVGFYNSGSHGITCKNCNAPINPDSVGQHGGCNPIPLDASGNGNTVTVLESSVVHGANQIKE